MAFNLASAKCPPYTRIGLYFLRSEINSAHKYLPVKGFVPEGVEGHDLVPEAGGGDGLPPEDGDPVLGRRVVAVLAPGHAEVGQKVVDLHVDVEQVGLEAGQVDHRTLQHEKKRHMNNMTTGEILCK